MSLRLRLIVLVALALAVSLAFGITVAGVGASRSVRTEMRTALAVARQTVESSLASFDGSADPTRDLEHLIASFDGNRHLRVSWSGDAAAVASPEPEAPAAGQIPAWFVGLVGVSPKTIRVPAIVEGRSFGAVTIETVPHNEILEAWNAFGGSLLVLALFSGTIIVLIYLFVGHALRPLKRLALALHAIGRGEYGIRLEERLPPELARLRDSFNRMAGQLAEMAEDNRRLNGELLTLQEQERSRIARDLHDEFGPFLFAINIDTTNISRALESRRFGGIADHVRSIADAVGHMQSHVRDMLARLRPVGLDEFGLNGAIAHLVEFWQRRNPAIAYRVTIAPKIEGFGEAIDTILYRVVQECLSNATRHGQPATVAVTLAIDRSGAPARIVLAVADDGRGIDAAETAGFGLRGMDERVRLAGGTLAVASHPGQGLTVTATLPLPARTLRPVAVASVP
jgi:two-component system, NarL family, sensor histidine kinase UhpB